MKPSRLLPLLLLLGTGCGGGDQPASTSPYVVSPSGAAETKGLPAPPTEIAKHFPERLVEARRAHVARPHTKQEAAEPAPRPPAGVFDLIKYDSPAGKLSAYLSPDPGDRKKHPAIVWITGGDCNSIGEIWDDSPRTNDQTAAAYRKAGIIMMFPSLRGGNDNPGLREGFFGEVDDVIAAADHLSKLDYVDPARIYLGGHSTGGTLAMLVAECSDRFRAVFSFGPADDVAGYGPESLPFDATSPNELVLRSPGRWLPSVVSPLFVFEGTSPPGNIDSLRAMARISKNPLIRFLPVDGASHFSVLAPINERIAAKILRDEGKTTNISFTPDELKATP